MGDFSKEAIILNISIRGGLLFEENGTLAS